MKGARALIKLATYEVEMLQMRLGEIAQRRTAFEMMMCSLEAEAEAETVRAKTDAEAGWYLVGYREGWKIRKAKLASALNACEMEEAGARDALSTAFETLKKYEHVSDMADRAAVKEELRRENAALDEIAMRRSSYR
ncbi:MAG: flagellar export protein FliJ [Caulobacteraceae bacterium]